MGSAKTIAKPAWHQRLQRWWSRWGLWWRPGAMARPSLRRSDGLPPEPDVAADPELARLRAAHHDNRQPHPAARGALRHPGPENASDPREPGFDVESRLLIAEEILSHPLDRVQRIREVEASMQEVLTRLRRRESTDPRTQTPESLPTSGATPTAPPDPGRGPDTAESASALAPLPWVDDPLMPDTVMLDALANPPSGPKS